MFESLTRRRYIVDWTLQGSLVRHGLLFGALVLVVMVGGMFAPLLWALDGNGDPAMAGDPSIVMLYLHERLWPLALLCAVIVVIGSIRFSHRIAGPMVRFKRNLRLLADGKLPPPLRTRPADYLQEEVDCLNAAVIGVRERTMAAQQAAAALRRQLQATAAADAVVAAGVDMTELLQVCDELRAHLDGFRDADPAEDLANSASAVPRPAPILAGLVE